MSLPADHRQRRLLNDEVHARPPDALAAPLRISFLALVSDWSARADQLRHVAAFAARYGAPAPKPEASHYSADFGAFRIKWERHTEFQRFNFIAPGKAEDAFVDPAINAVPRDFIDGLSGEVIVATHIGFLAAGPTPDFKAIAARYFDDAMLIGASLAGGAAYAMTDYRIRDDGFGRLLMQDVGTSPRQAGRTAQRLVEIEAYRMLALLALPVARDIAPVLTEDERALAAITTSLVGAREADEPDLLDRLTRLEAEIESRQAAHRFRFSASAAYYQLVLQRIADLRETRVEGLQTFQEFTERRLAPAMNFCVSVVARQEQMSEHVARANQMLATRVAISREQQNLAVLASMDKRARMQLRLQETVEGLSVAAITYYLVALIAHAAEAAHGLGLRVEADIVAGFSIPVVAVLVAFGIRRVRRRVMGRSE